MAEFTCAVVGLGNIGLLYDSIQKSDYMLTHTKAYLKHPRCKLIFGVDKDAKRRELFERYAKTPAFRTIDEAKKVFTGIDIVSICVHPENRMEVVPGAVGLRPRVIFMEKPLASDCKEAQKIMALCRMNKITLAVNYHRRFDKITHIIKELRLNKRLGALLHVDAAYNKGFFSNASHYVDMLSYIVGKPKSYRIVRKVKAGRDHDIDFILFYGSTDAYFKVIKTDVPIGELHFWFERGKIEYKKFGNEIIYHNITKDRVFKGYEELSLEKTVKSDLPYVMHHAVDNICNFLKTKERLLSSGKSAFDTLRICESITKNG